MLKIIIKTILLVLIILSIYFIVNPSACSNLINGRAVNVREDFPTLKPTDKQKELLTPVGDQPLRTENQSTAQTPQSADQTTLQKTKKPGVVFTPTQPAQEKTSAAVEPSSVAQPVGVTDTNSLQQPQSSVTTQPSVTTADSKRPQLEVDYAIASRYVELENNYLTNHKDAQNAAKDISYIVMDDFELTPSEWEAFLQRATAENLFEKVRQEQAKK